MAVLNDQVPIRKALAAADRPAGALLLAGCGGLLYFSTLFSITCSYPVASGVMAGLYNYSVRTFLRMAGV